MRWWPIIILGAAQFLMVLDSSVMNVAISQLVADFDTNVTQIQTVITLYSLVIAALLLTGAKIGDILGRRRAFVIGMVIYAIGSALTAASWNVASLTIGWSVLEGIGAALVLPALVALISDNYKRGHDRIFAYSVIGGLAGAGIAVGPILGGWLTTDLSWRVVFVGEVVVAVLIMLFVRKVSDTRRVGETPQLDWVGSILSAFGVGLAVFGVLQATTWGWIRPVDSPIEPFGLSLTPFMVATGIAILLVFWSWQGRRETHGRTPLVHTAMMKISVMRAGLATLLAQTLILAGVFFAIPVYLQLVQGLDALETGIRMLPVSIAMFLTSMAGSQLITRFSARTIVRLGLVVLLAGVLLLMASINRDLSSFQFGVAMALLGVGMGFMVSQLGNVVQSSVGEAEQSEAGGLSGTAQQLGSALGVALIGSIVISGLANNLITRVANDDRIAGPLQDDISTGLSEGVSFVSSSDVEAAATEAGLDPESTAALVDNYEVAQILSLQTGIIVVAGIVLLALFSTRGLPSEKPTRDVASDDNGADQDEGAVSV